MKKFIKLAIARTNNGVWVLDCVACKTGTVPFYQER